MGRAKAKTASVVPWRFHGTRLLFLQNCVSLELLILLVPLAGLEPARCCHHLILSQARLPIPPQGLDRCDHSGEAQGVNGPIPLPPSHRYMGRGSMGTTAIGEQATPA